MPVSGAPHPGRKSRPGRGGAGHGHAGAQAGQRSSERRGTRDCRLPRSLRITDSSVFKQAFDTGAKYVGRFMVMWLRTGDDACLRLGVVTSKRSFRRAVDRAKARRILREAYRLNRWRLDGDCDVVLVARRRLLEVHLNQVQAELLKLAGKAGMLKASE